MGIGSFFTLQTLIPGQANAATSGGASSAPGQQQLPALSFIDFLLARALEQAEQGQTQKHANAHDLLQSSNPALKKNAGLDIVDLLAQTPDIAEEVKAGGFDPKTQLFHTLALNKTALDNVLKPLTDGIITTEAVEGGSPRIMQALLVGTEGTGETVSDNSKQDLQALKLIFEKLEKLAADPETSGLVVTNLTPEQITAIKNKIQNLLDGTAETPAEGGNPVEDPLKDFGGIYIGLINILPPQAKPDAITLPQGVFITQGDEGLQITKQQGNKLPADMVAKINALVSDMTETGEIAPATFKQNPAGFQQAPEDLDFEQALKDFSETKNINPGEIKGPDTPKTPSVKPDLSTLQNWQFPVAGNIVTTPQWHEALYQEFAAQSPALTLTGPGNFTNLVTQASSAPMPHPAIQMVAATIQKSAASGESKNITIQLEPPELGRVEIRMSFEKNKAVKAILVAEKPETYAMLQRDSHTLERTLIDSGLSTDGSSLSFELADQGYEFNHRGGHDGSGNYAGKNADGEEEIIQSTMTWHIDPETGHMRYDILT